MPLEPEADLEWTAYLYVTGGLSSLEEAAFELHLAEDQVAREAVAGAVELAGALAAIEPGDWVRPRRHRSSARRVLAWSALAAAASLVVASLWALRSSRSTAPPDATEVAIAWSGLRRLEPIGGGEVDVFAPVDEPSPAVDLEAPADPALPSWLLTAAAEPRADSPQQEN
jgi:hypothetical protein